MTVSKYIEKQKSPQKEILKKLRKLMKKAFPKLEEKMQYGVPCFGNKFYLAGLKDSVNMGFAVTGLSKEEKALFKGGGKTMKHLKFKSVEEVDGKEVARLAKLVQKKAKCVSC